MSPLNPAPTSGVPAIHRRAFLSGALAFGAAFHGPRPPAAQATPRAAQRASSDVARVQVLAFDVFGTVVDWRASVIAEGEQLGRQKGLTVDWAAFADAWRGAYGPSMNRVRRGELPWTKLDTLHRMVLDELLERFGIKGLTEDETRHFNRVWHRLRPWPDAVEGLRRLRTRFVITTLSNGNVALLTNMAKYAGLQWDCIFSAETFHHYKPDAETYLGAAEMLDQETDKAFMSAEGSAVDDQWHLFLSLGIGVFEVEAARLGKVDLIGRDGKFVADGTKNLDINFRTVKRGFIGCFFVIDL